jgi:hypothetical protein
LQEPGNYVILPLALLVHGRRLALLFHSQQGGQLLFVLHSPGREGDSMYVTYTDLIQIGLLIVAIIALIQDNKKQK